MISYSIQKGVGMKRYEKVFIAMLIVIVLAGIVAVMVRPG